MSPLLVLIVAVLATTYAGPIVRFAAAPALAIAFWRLVLVLPVTGGLAVLEGSGEQGAGSSVTREILLPAPCSLLPSNIASPPVTGRTSISLQNAIASAGAAANRTMGPAYVVASTATMSTSRGDMGA